MMMVLRQITLYLAWIFAVTATLGNLYFSDVRGFKLIKGALFLF